MYTLNKNKISHASYLHVLESTLHRVHESTSYMIIKYLELSIHTFYP